MRRRFTRSRSSALPGSTAVVAALLTLASLCLPSDPGGHLGHPAGATETLVFDAAAHARQAAHWEAAGEVRLSRCGTCLAPGPSFAPVRVAVAGHLRPLTDRRAVAPAVDLSDPGAGRSQRPRAPPLSARS